MKHLQMSCFRAVILRDQDVFFGPIRIPLNITVSTFSCTYPGLGHGDSRLVFGLPRGLEDLQREAPWRCPTISTAHFNARSSGCTPSSLRMSELFTLSLKLIPATHRKKNHFSCLCPQSRSFGHYPEFVTAVDNWKVDLLVYQKL